MNKENFKRVREVEKRLEEIAKTRYIINESKRTLGTLYIGVKDEAENYRSFTPEPAIKDMLYAMIESKTNKEESDLLEELKTL